MKKKKKKVQIPIVRKCDYEDIAVCIKSDQVRPAASSNVTNTKIESTTKK